MHSVRQARGNATFISVSRNALLTPAVPRALCSGVSRLEDGPDVRGRTAPDGSGVRPNAQTTDHRVRAIAR